MALERNPVFVALFFVLCLGLIASYVRLWIIDFYFSKDDTERLRKQFDLTYKKATEEQVVWRQKFDEKAKRSIEHVRELIQLRKALEQKTEETESIKRRLSALQKSKEALEQKMEET